MWSPIDEDYTKHIGKMVRINYEGDYYKYNGHKYDLYGGSPSYGSEFMNKFDIIQGEERGVVEGKLIHIKEYLARKHFSGEEKLYAIKIIDNKNREIKMGYPLVGMWKVNVIIKNIYDQVETRERNTVVNKICEKYLLDDLSNIINQYVDTYIKI